MYAIRNSTIFTCRDQMSTIPSTLGFTFKYPIPPSRSQLVSELPYPLLRHFTYGGRVGVEGVFIRRERELAPGGRTTGEHR